MKKRKKSQCLRVCRNYVSHTPRTRPERDTTRSRRRVRGVYRMIMCKSCVKNLFYVKHHLYNARGARKCTHGKSHQPFSLYGVNLITEEFMGIFDMLSRCHSTCILCIPHAHIDIYVYVYLYHTIYQHILCENNTYHTCDELVCAIIKALKAQRRASINFNC